MGCTQACAPEAEVGRDEINFSKDSMVAAFRKRTQTMASFRVSSLEDLSFLSEGNHDEAMEFVRHFYQEAVIFSKGQSHVAAHGPYEYDMKLEHLQALAGRLEFNDLKEGELSRMFEAIPRSPDGFVTMKEFATAVAYGPASHSLQSLVKKLRLGYDSGFVPPDDYDFSKPTSENYRSNQLDFYGPFAKFRELCDYSYHVNYTRTRQYWQDEAIKSMISRAVEQPAPWLVYTCGPMGVGKGYTLSWMSQNGFFPLENIVHIDPDAFKMMMPEWPDYVAKDRDKAGTHCHLESSFMVEIAQAAAMEKKQNIWIDGSLRDADFYHKAFSRIRETHPNYRISIFYITASEHTIRQRIQHRAEQTGRDVPEHLIIASLQAMDKSLNTLTPLCDFVARINNEGNEPVLVAFETVDTKGNWGVISDRFARTYHDRGEFPQSCPTLRLLPLHENLTATIQSPHLIDSHNELSLRLDLAATAKCDAGKLSDIFGSSVILNTAPRHQVRLPESVTPLPEGATSVFWIYPCGSSKVSYSRRLQNCNALQDPSLSLLGQLLLYGGFAYCRDADICMLHVVTSAPSSMLMQFGKPFAMKAGTIPKEWFQEVISPYFLQQGARQYCWLSPGETYANTLLSHGAFAYLMDESSLLVFPVV
mmetsp:Transcript_40435/g.93878  ORF Transcript_40435/g.93878 Transcript_40435/m.93878 type:complete len:646 (-) Transcript_40435:89-2026(-)